MTNNNNYFNELMGIAERTTNLINKDVKSKPKPKPKPKSIQVPRAAPKYSSVGDKIIKDMTTSSKVAGSKMRDVISQSRLIDKKIKESKSPSYEDLALFHKLSTKWEDIT